MKKTLLIRVRNNPNFFTTTSIAEPKKRSKSWPLLTKGSPMTTIRI